MMFAAQEIPDDTRRAVNAATARSRLPQSVMLSGGSQALREQCAKELCMAALCAAPAPGTQIPCGQCHCCRKVLAGTHPDVMRILPTGGRKTVSIRDVREQLQETLYKSPTEADNKVYLFDGADALSPQIQNALLKSVEEPPEDVMFLFLCEQRESMLTTVISRLTEYPLGDTLSAGQREEDEAVTATAKEIAAALASGDEYTLMLKTAPMAKNRAMMAQTAAQLIRIVRDALAEHSGARLLSGCDREALLLASRYDAPALMEIKAAMDRIVSNAAANANENLLLTLFSCSLAPVMKQRK
ncbi:MAG: hypothetical protein IJK89_12500 [Clostridia bacterium]|nr:hypothetical protein [Clostridia bacterium]